MGMLDTIVESSDRFREDLLPVGYAERNISWVINISFKDDIPPSIIKKAQGELTLKCPATPADRTSGKISPSLLVDKVSYVLGIHDSGKKGDAAKIAAAEHNAFLSLLQKCADETNDPQVKRILTFLEKEHDSITIENVKANHLCVFQIDQEPWPTDSTTVQSFWSKYVEERLAEDKQQCVICCKIKPITRILPFKVTLMKGTDPVQLSSFNLDAFQSLGKTMGQTKEEDGEQRKRKAGANAAICYACASTAGQVLQHLVKIGKDEKGSEKLSDRHAVIIARDKRQVLGNQIAVFWTKEPVNVRSFETRNIEFEDIARIPIEDFDEIPEGEPPVKAGQLRSLLEAPFMGVNTNVNLPSNRFYLGVLSPNKSRLVVREWLETDIQPVQENIKQYIEALQIIHPDGRGTWWPPLPALLEALQSYTSARQKNKESPRVPTIGPEAMRQLIRCIYTGTPPPEALLTRALRCFRIPDVPTDDLQQQERQMRRRMAIAAAMKLILTYNKNKKEQQAMEQLKTGHDSASSYKKGSPYNCGRLLAILEAIQRKASTSGRGVNTTLVDRFYASASIAPATVFANLISMATKAHLPKLRREGKELFKVRYQEETVNINDLMNEVCKAIDDAGGFPPPLEPEDQAAFALGFYHQRAEFTSPKTKPKATPTAKTNPKGV